jgi:hypothetical protein
MEGGPTSCGEVARTPPCDKKNQRKRKKKKEQKKNTKKSERPSVS